MTTQKSSDGGEGPVEVPETLSVLPLRNSVLFPGSIIPIDVGRKKSVRLVEEAISRERPDPQRPAACRRYGFAGARLVGRWPAGARSGRGGLPRAGRFSG